MVSAQNRGTDRVFSFLLCSIINGDDAEKSTVSAESCNEAFREVHGPFQSNPLIFRMVGDFNVRVSSGNPAPSAVREEKPPPQTPLPS